MMRASNDQTAVRGEERASIVTHSNIEEALTENACGLNTSSFVSCWQEGWPLLGGLG